MKRIFAGLALLFCMLPAGAQPPGPGPLGPPGQGPPPLSNEVPQTEGPRVNFYGSWDQAMIVARRTDRPIFLVSGAPQCHGVSGVW